VASFYGMTNTTAVESILFGFVKLLAVTDHHEANIQDASLKPALSFDGLQVVVPLQVFCDLFPGFTVPGGIERSKVFSISLEGRLFT